MMIKFSICLKKKKILKYLIYLLLCVTVIHHYSVPVRKFLQSVEKLMFSKCHSFQKLCYKNAYCLTF